MNLGLSLTLARIGFIFPDMSNFMSLAGRLFMYGSGVIFPIERFVENNPVIASIIQINPIYHMLLMYRSVLIDNTVPPLESWLIFGAWAVGLLLVGFVVFWQGEASYGDDR